MKKNRYTLLLIDFIPIILLFLFVTQPKETILFSNTSLGKMIALSIIIFYIHVNIVYGFFVCVLIMFYYQSDLVENTLNSKMDSLEQMNQEYREFFSPQNEIVDTQTTPEDESPQSLPFIESPLLSPYVASETELFSYEPYVPHNEKNEDILNGVDKKAQLKEIFRKQYCVNGQLKMKGEKVKTEMASHIFRELDSPGLNCNPCDETCDFSIIEERLKNEEDLVKPKDSNMWYDTVLSLINDNISGFLPGWNID